MGSLNIQEDFTVLKRRIKRNVSKQAKVFPNMHTSFASGLGPLEPRKKRTKYNTLTFNFAILHHTNSQANLNMILNNHLASIGPEMPGEFRKEVKKVFRVAWDFYLKPRNSMGISPRTFIDLERLDSLKSKSLWTDDKTLSAWILSVANPLINYEHLGLTPDDDQLYRSRFRTYAFSGPLHDKLPVNETEPKLRPVATGEAEKVQMVDDAKPDSDKVTDERIEQQTDIDAISISSTESGIFFDMPHEQKRKYGISIHPDSDSEGEAELLRQRSGSHPCPDPSRVTKSLFNPEAEQIVDIGKPTQQLPPQEQVAHDAKVPVHPPSGLPENLKGPLRTMWRLLALNNLNKGKTPGPTLLWHFQWMFNISDADECKLWKEINSMDDAQMEILNEAHNTEPVSFDFDLAE